MKGTCCKCGCTDARACPDGCSWIDTQEDLCSRCAAELMTAPLDNLSDALLVVRALRSTLGATVAELLELKQTVGQLAFIAGEAFAATAAKPAGQIWTPE